MRFPLVVITLFSVLLLPLTTFVSAASDGVVHINSCDKEQYKQQLDVSGSILQLQSSCSNGEVLELSVKAGSYFKLLSKFLYPYSFVLKSVKEIDSDKNHAAVIQLAPSEPEPTGSYYFAVVDLESMTLITDGYSDSEVYVYDIDKDGIEEIVFGGNLSAVNSLDTLLDFVPYPKVLDWNCHGGLRLVGSQAYPQLMDAYRKSLSYYITQLSETSENTLGSMKATLDVELAFAQAMMAGAISDNSQNTSFMTNNAECGQ